MSFVFGDHHTITTPGSAQQPLRMCTVSARTYGLTGVRIGEMVALADAMLGKSLHYQRSSTEADDDEDNTD